ncbi:MAG: Zn-ribbon domain-containing OB-fold protein [Deltaproteobacteria bacterium]|nr:Zn-ribbon domain-containing OB-fold protein [Deltaproteobacteria bacterium]MBW2342944.1 Zn-ribbon domain-containing OB-fold protein [Deltaproteobacteria bacterium]
MPLKSVDAGHTETLYVKRVVDVPYSYNAGKYVSRYLNELKEHKRIIGSKCSSCKKVFVPPRVSCSQCFQENEEFVQVSDAGSITAFTVTTVPYTDPNTGEPKKLPFTAAYIKLDGADTNIMHCINETDGKVLKTGLRVRAVFSENRTGDHFTDIKYFAVIRD